MAGLVSGSPVLATLAGTLALATVPAVAQANGNVSHQWVSRTAIDDTPRGGSLHALVGDPSLLPFVETGTMFPDWGYTPGATDLERDAGEASHWEPVQDAYRRWILAHYAPPWSDEARQHLAFYLGMTSHGLADQSYDSMFFERSRSYQGGDHGEFDQDTDVLWAATAGPGEAPGTWLPAAALIELFGSVVGVTIDEPRLAQQVGFVAIGIQAVNALAADPAQLADAEADFPWAALHDDDPAVPGNPPHEAEIVRRYWRSNWALVHGDPVPRPVLWTHPADGTAAHPTDATSIESWLSVVFARALTSAELDATQFHVVDGSGGEVPITIDLFYGEASHVVHVRPAVDLVPDEVYVVTIDPGVATIHGEALEGWSFAFSTGAQAPDPRHDDGFWDAPDPYDDDAVDATGTGGDTAAGGSETGGDATGAPEASTGSPATGGDATGASGEGGAIDGDAPSGCGCASGPAGGEGAPWLILLPWWRRRRIAAAAGGCTLRGR